MLFVWFFKFQRKFSIRKRSLNIAGNELIDVISKKKFSSTFSVEDIVDAIDFFDAISTFVPTEKKFSGSPDIKDDYLFDLANQSETKIIVTGDKKLLDFKTENISLITFSEFL